MPYHLATPLCGKGRGIGTLPIPHCFVGWVKGLEPSTPGTTIRCSNQLSYTHHIYIRTGKVLTLQGKMARQKGLEPLAYCLEGSCSIQLSYWRVSVKLERVTGIEPASPAWKAGALAIVLHPHGPSAEIVSFVILAHEYPLCQDKIQNNPYFICAAHQQKSGAASAASSRRQEKLCRSG